MALTSFSPNTLIKSSEVNANFQYLQDLITALVPSGSIIEWGGKTAPTNWLLCDGSNVSRTTYANLFSALNPLVGTLTVTIAAPAVVTLNNHGLQTGDQVYLTTTGALPTGLSTNTLYYAVRIDANTFNLATSRANAVAGTKITTSGTQSGTHSLNHCPFGLGDGSTTFGVPDFRGRVPAGVDAMGGTLASRLTLAKATGVSGNPGASGGAEAHQLVIAELASHNHLGAGSTAGNGISGGVANTSNPNAFTTSNTGGDGTHNNVQPTLVVNFIVKT